MTPTNQIYLTRAVDFIIAATSHQLSIDTPPTLAAWHVPARLWVTLAAPPHPATGFVVNVTKVDAAFRQTLAQQPVHALNPFQLLTWAAHVVQSRLSPARLVQLQLMCADQRQLTLFVEKNTMMQLTSKYELAASHKLWNPDWDQKQNTDAFGKCSNPRGHGHNYSVEVTLRSQANPTTGLDIQTGQIDHVVNKLITKRFDHKNLNEDTTEFAQLLPTVENMARVFFELLDGQFQNAQLAAVRVWETEKTYAEYFGDQNQPLRYSNTV